MQKTFSIDCSIEERWIPYFLGMLERMKRNGIVGHSEMIAFYSDGDGDFRPKFTFPNGFSYMTKPTLENEEVEAGSVFDAG